MKIINCEIADVETLLQFYDWGREWQQKKSNRHWQEFNPASIVKEIEEKRQWKIVEKDEVVCVFLTAYGDPFIWGEKDKDPSVYIHRIVTHPAHRGKGYVRKIVEWAKIHAAGKNLEYVRMDTWGDNQVLVDYYVKCGFTFLGVITPVSTHNLPAHYDCISLSLFQLKIGS